MDGVWMVTADVTSLYTIIPHHFGIGAVKYYLRELSKIPIIQQNNIIELLEFAASHNYFWFNNNFYGQKRDVAMGAKYAPSLVNLFMVKWDEEVVFTDRSLFLTFWARYIHDVLFLWEGTKPQLEEFFVMLNNNQRGIKFT